MARLVPMLEESQLRALSSRAEADVYAKCRELWSDDTIVLFSMPWIRVGPYGQPRDGETDFVILDSSRGILSIEVKGGGVEVDPRSDAWTSVDRRGARHQIKDPFEQAKREKYALRDFLAEQRNWRRLGSRPTVGHAVLFPDLDVVASLGGPSRPDAIIGARGDVTRLDVWLEQVLAFWAGDGAPVGVGREGMKVLKHLFCTPVEVKPLMSLLLAEEEEERIRLTEEQGRLLTGLGRRRRAAIAGGAGTGKTLLATEKARRCASDGMETLLLCYNRPLANHLQHCLGNVAHAHVMSFHQLSDLFTRRAKRLTGRDLLEEAKATNPTHDKYEVHFPHALALATECVPDRYDAIIVDEAQDFGEEYWLPVELLLRDEAESALFLFYDHNQAVYRRVSSFPITDEPFLLTRNCRNTRPIHEAAYQYYEGERTEPPTIAGEEVSVLSAHSRGGQAKRLHAHLVSLLDHERVRPEDIAVLVPSRGHHEYYQALEGRPLPAGRSWAIEEYGIDGGVRVETVHRFKGLEATVVYLWGVDSFSPEADIETLYVTLSRAKSRLILVGDEKRCAGILKGASR